MKTIITIVALLSFANSFILLHMLWLYRLDIRKATVGDNTVVGLGFWWRTAKGYTERILYLPLRNANKHELHYERQRLRSYSDHNRRQSLRAKFSWLKTTKEVQKFRNDYLCVDAELVTELCEGFQK